MKNYQQKTEKISRVIPLRLVSRIQPSIYELLQSGVLASPHRQERQENKKRLQNTQVSNIQRVIDPDISAALSLDTPVFQLNGTKACWFLSVLYGVFKAGWIRSLFENEYVKVQCVADSPNTYKCIKEGVELVVQKMTNKRPLWQQILEAFMADAINKLASPYPKWLNVAVGSTESFQKRLLSLGSMGGLPRDNLKASVEQLLQMICGEWKLEECRSSIPAMAGKATSPFQDMKGKTYLTPERSADDTQIVKLLTVEKTGHAMGVKSATFSPAALPQVSKAPPPPPGGIRISGISVFNQYFSAHNMAEYKDITPDTSGKLGAKKGASSWATPIDSINYYKLRWLKTASGPTG